MKKELRLIQERNRKVEADKAWETSRTRRLIIAGITYCTAVVFLWIISAPQPFLTALVPTLGFLLSTLTLPFFKRWWIKKTNKK
ncbi:TPA: hypothetical protein HA228_00585 [Candidatus Woesearchaeota archaeon]|nr:MAG: hypothetical protein QT04_C0026G0003 [archaeon GW2011_AR11]MBS3111489.1 hypothetical protein [Candidatus Woesearchaeota archaeon]HIH04699.1 hypothetical protein [Candidatus Woesearchaeota archaeon]HII64381.1 hypothetical protein [Candidatus Woesearchaeota archaeon]HII65660.1 hypothetical protein [Candidatus Woesearchaeota archaeon]